MGKRGVLTFTIYLSDDAVDWIAALSLVQCSKKKRPLSQVYSMTSEPAKRRN